MLVIIVETAIRVPRKYAPLSPKKILAFGKLNKVKINTDKICDIKITEKDESLITDKNIKFMIKKWIPKRPLNPSTKLAPLITNKKHNKTKQFWNNLFSSHIFKKDSPVLSISIEKRFIHKIKTDVMSNKRILGFIFIFKSSNSPRENNAKEIIR